METQRRIELERLTVHAMSEIAEALVVARAPAGVAGRGCPARLRVKVRLRVAGHETLAALAARARDEARYYLDEV